MVANLAGLVDSFAGRKVLVFGEAILDRYLEGAPARLCREAPVPVVALDGRHDAPGGAANAAANVAALGARATFVSAVGADAEAEALRQLLQTRGVCADHLLARPGRRTLAKTRVLAAGQLLIRLDEGNTEPIDAATEAALIDRLADLFPAHDAIIISDYSYGLVTPGLIAALADLQRKHQRTVLIDSRHRAAEFRVIEPTAIKPNFEEAAGLLGIDPAECPRDRAGLIARRGEIILEKTGARFAAVTLDSEGCVLLERGRTPYRTYCRPARRSSVAGAGDTFVAAFTLALAAGALAHAAAELASAAAAVVVAKEGTAVCSAAELLESIAGGGKFVPEPRRLAERVDFHRQQGRRIIFTNGCFDILHPGHIAFLSQAKALGDVLVVGVNTDAGIRRIKGPNRPINTLEDRLQVLAALSCVDHLIAFDEDTPAALIRAVRPDVYVKGGDYERGRLPEAAVAEELGAEVRFLPYLPDRSTAGLIEKIRQARTPPEAAVQGQPAEAR